jgi:hypothetical protein
MKTRTTTAAAILLGAVMTLAACGGGGGGSSSAALTPSRPSPPPTDQFGSTPGTPPAWDAANKLAAVPAGWRDCGQDVPTAGWPTTFVLRPERWGCIVSAARAGTPAEYSLLARDHRGGVDVTLFEILGNANVRIVTQNVDWTGTPGSPTEQACTGLRAPSDYTGDATCTRP